jgi:hypothetical protein
VAVTQWSPELERSFVTAHGRPPNDDGDRMLWAQQVALLAESNLPIEGVTPEPPPPVTPLANRLPGAAKAVITGRIKPTKEWLADVEKGPKRDRPFVPSVWRNHALNVIERERVKAEPSKVALTAWVRMAEKEQDGNGFLVLTFWFMARWLLGCWPGLAQRCVRWMVDHFLVCPQPTRVRDGKFVMNGPNAYTLQMPDEVPEPDDPPETVPATDAVAVALSVMRRIARAWEYWRPRFGLVARPSGWANTSPQRQWKDDDPLPA